MAIQSPPRKVGRPRKPPPPRPRRTPGSGSISVTKAGRVFALDVRSPAGRRPSYEAIGADVDARYADAERWLADQAAERVAARTRDDRALETVRSYLNRWLWTAHRASPTTTRRTVRTRIRKAEPIGDVVVAELTPALVDQITDAMREAGLSSRYCRLVRSTLKTAFSGLVPMILATNPVSRYPGRLPITKRRPNVWDERDAADFERSARRSRWGLLWVLAVRYGLRGGELRALCWSDLTARSRELVVRHGLRVGRELADTKSHTERSILIVRSLVDQLDAFAASEHSSPTWMFSQAGGAALTVHTFDDEFRAIVTAVNARRHAQALAAGRSEIQAQQTSLPSLTPHGLRHTAATLMLRRGVPVVKVSEILGHADAGFTYSRYGWAVPSDDDVVDRAIDGLMAPPGGSAGISG